MRLCAAPTTPPDIAVTLSGSLSGGVSASPVAGSVRTLPDCALSSSPVEASSTATGSRLDMSIWNISWALAPSGSVATTVISYVPGAPPPILLFWLALAAIAPFTEITPVFASICNHAGAPAPSE